MIRYLWVFLISMVPVLELRASIPYGAHAGFPWYMVLAISVIGNMLPVPFILLLLEWLLKIMKKIKYLDRFALWLEARGEKNKVRVQKYATFGLLLFVGIPLPGTGAWTGAIVASMLKMNRGRAMLSIAGGVVLAGVIVTLISYGVLGFLSFLLTEV